jgi:hypothetical protein
MFLDTSIKHIDFIDRIEMTKDNKRRAEKNESASLMKKNGQTQT